MRICFVSMSIYPALYADGPVKEIGGAEVQQVQIARLLQRLGHDVAFVTTDHGQPDGDIVDGCQVFKAYRPDAGVPGVRFLHPRWTGMWRALRRARADVYYTRAAGILPAMLALLKRRQRCRYIFAGASDSDFMLRHPRLHLARDRWLFHRGLLRADVIVTQSEQQRALLQQNFGRDALVIPNFMDAEPRQLNEADRTQILWVGSLRDVKRPSMFVELARSLPEFPFTMIGPRAGGDQSDLYDSVASAASGVSNLRFLGFQPLAEVERHFDHCRVLVSTSSVEGFPNVFLQAMRRGIPIVSFVDPDGMIAGGRLGAVVSDEHGLREAVRAMAGLPPQAAAGIREQFAARFGPDSVADRYRALLDQLQP